MMITILSYTIKVINIDTITPNLSVSSVIRTITSTENVYAVTFGPSGGSVSCINKSRSNASVTTYASIGVLGPNTIECTATSNAGLSSTVSAVVTINGYYIGSYLGTTGGAYKSGDSIYIPNGGLQFGPYAKANKGCYRVVYYGNNLNASPSGVSAIQHTPDIHYQVHTHNSVSNDMNYYIYISEDIDGTGLELYYQNSSSSTVRVDRIEIWYVGSENCATYSNLVWNGSYENGSSGWNNATNIVSGGYTGSKSLKFNAGSSVDTHQTFDTAKLKLNHKYYGALMFKSSSNFSKGDSRFELWAGDNMDGGDRLIFGRKNLKTTTWQRISSIQTITTDAYLNKNWFIRNLLHNPNSDSYTDDLIIVDLTETFGAGNEPTKEWCDANITYVDGVDTDKPTISGISVSGTKATISKADTGGSGWIGGVSNGSTENGV